MELFYDLIGPEQTSNHFEKFSRSRKYLLTYASMFLGMGYFINYGGLDLVSYSMQSYLFANFLIFYFLLEGRKFMFVPF